MAGARVERGQITYTSAISIRFPASPLDLLGMMFDARVGPNVILSTSTYALRVHLLP